MRQAVALLATFAVVLAFVLGASALAPTVTGDTQEDLPEVQNPQYTDESLLVEKTPGQASVTMSADVEPQTIVIDPGIDTQQQRPGPREFLFGFAGPETAEREILPLVNTLVENGHNVTVYTPPEGQQRPSGLSRPGESGQSLSPLGQELASADAFVTFRTDYSDEELADVETFAEEDGRVLLAREPDDAFEEPGGLGFNSALGVTSEPGYVYNLEENDLNYQRIFAEPDGGSSLTEGVDRVVFPSASPVDVANSPDGTLVPTEGAELSTTRAETDAPVLAHRGDVVVVGDTDFLIPENTQRADNDVLVGNLADFLVTNNRSPGTQPPEQSEQDSGPERPTRPTPPSGPTGGPGQPPEPEPEPTPSQG